jgi:hypothetical protein
MRSTYSIGLAAVFAGLVLSAPPALADIEDTGGISNQTPVGETYVTFLEVVQGARGAGMGDAFVGVVDDISAVFWNPAGLTAMPKNRLQFTFTNTQWFVDSQFNSGAVGVNTDYGSFAFSVVTVQPPDMLETTILQPAGTGRTIDSGSWAVGGAYAKQFTDLFSLGVQFRVVQERLDTGFDFRVFDMAIGTKYYTGFRNLRVAMSIRNFGRDKVLFDNGRIRGKMPVIFSVATAAEVIGEKEDPAYLTGAFEYLYSVSVERRLHFGGELWLRNLLALRGGYKWNYDVQDFTAGAGVKLQRGVHYIRVDFGWQNIKNNQFDPPLRFSVTGSF